MKVSFTQENDEVPFSRLFRIAVLAAGFCLAACQTPGSARKFAATGLLSGDVLFQDSRSSQSEDIRAITKSPYCHVGILMRENGGDFVYHAGHPVGRVPFATWVGTDKGYGEARRLRPTGLTDGEVRRLRAVLTRHAGKSYDPLFQDERDRLYCSEYVAIGYLDGLGVDLGPAETFAQLGLTNEVRERLEARYAQAGKTFDAQEPVISPERLRKSPHLVRAK